MLDHIGVYVADFERAKKFYSVALAPIGYSMLKEFPEWSTAGFGGADGHSDFWISQRESAHNVHLCFKADKKDAVDAFYKAGLEAGGTDNGAPGYRKEYDAGYYAAFVTDPDGNNLEVVFNDPLPAQTNPSA